MVVSGSCPGGRRITGRVLELQQLRRDDHLDLDHHADAENLSGTGHHTSQPSRAAPRDHPHHEHGADERARVQLYP
jgi:hypothetical protein